MTSTSSSPLALAAAWALLTLLHLAPAAVAVRPSLLFTLYGVAPAGELGVMLRHRGVLFAALVVLGGLAVFDTGARRAASLAFAVSMLGFLALYVAAGAPEGALRRVAWADLAALPLLAYALVKAWA